MPSFSMPEELITLGRFLLGIAVVVPPLYFTLTGFRLVCEYRKKEKDIPKSGLVFCLKKIFLSPLNIFLACMWASATVYVFCYAYIWPLGVKPLPYQIFEIIDRGPYPKISVLLEAPFTSPSGGDVAATCMAAGKYYSEKRGWDAVTVEVLAFRPSGFYYGHDAMLGQCTYGVHKEDLQFELEGGLAFRAADKVSPLRLKINALWGSLANDFRDPKRAVLDENALGKKISQLTGASLEEATLEEIRLHPVMELLLPKVEAQAPTNPEREKILPQIMKIKDFADTLRLRIFERCFFLRAKSASAQKIAILEKLQKQLAVLEAMIHNDPALPAGFKELPGLFNEYADSCARNTCSELPLAKIYTIVNTE